MQDVQSTRNGETEGERVLQGSPEWKAQRLGKVTASRISDLMARTKPGSGASRSNYLSDLVMERLTGNPADSIRSAAMQWGTDTESEARAAYGMYIGLPVEVVSFVEHPRIVMSGCSPDGLVGNDGLVEIKCPGSKTHIQSLLGNGISSKYLDQMQWQMACTGRAWCDWVSYDPRMPPEMSIEIRRVPRDSARIVEIERAVVAFLAEVDEAIADLVKRFGGE